MDNSANIAYINQVKLYFPVGQWDTFTSSLQSSYLVLYSIYQSQLASGLNVDPPKFVKTFEERKKQSDLETATGSNSSRNLKLILTNTMKKDTDALKQEVVKMSTSDVSTSKNKENSETIVIRNAKKSAKVDAGVTVKVEPSTYMEQQSASYGKMYNSLNNGRHYTETANVDAGVTVKVEPSTFMEQQLACYGQMYNSLNNGRHYSETLKYNPVKCTILNNCDQCDFQAPNKYFLAKHKRTDHRDVKLFPCVYCNHTATQKINLANHINAKHFKIKNFKCLHCNFSATQEINVINHINSIHLKIKKFNCDYCDYGTAHKINLSNHVNSKHLKFFRYKCEQCDYGSTQRGNVVTHYHTVHLRVKKEKKINFSY